MPWDDSKSTASDPSNPTADEQLTAAEWNQHVTDGHFPADELNLGVNGSGNPVLTDPQNGDAEVLEYDRSAGQWVLSSLSTEVLANDNRPWDFIVRRHSDGDLQVIDEGGEVAKNSDDATAFQTLINTLSTNGDTVGIFVDSLDLTGQINATELTSVTFVGKSFSGRPTIKINTSSSPVFDWTGSSRITWEKVQFRVESTATPAVVHFLSRTSGGTPCNRWVWRDVMFNDLNDNVGTAFVYNYGAELQRYENSEFDVGGAAGIVLTQSNIDGITSPHVSEATGGQSTTQITFDSTDFYGNGNDVVNIEIEQCGDITFIDALFPSPAASYSVKFRQNSGVSTTNGVSFNDCRWEGRMFTADTPSGNDIRIEYLSISGGTVQADDTGPLWDFDKDDGGSNRVFVLKPNVDNSFQFANIDSKSYEIDLHTCRGGDFWLTEEQNDVALSASNTLRESHVVVADESSLTLGGNQDNNIELLAWVADKPTDEIGKTTGSWIQNTTGHPILVSADVENSGAGSPSRVQLKQADDGTGTGEIICTDSKLVAHDSSSVHASGQMIVPNDQYYMVNVLNGSIRNWTESKLGSI